MRWDELLCRPFRKRRWTHKTVLLENDIIVDVQYEAHEHVADQQPKKTRSASWDQLKMARKRAI